MQSTRPFTYWYLVIKSYKPLLYSTADKIRKIRIYEDVMKGL